MLFGDQTIQRRDTLKNSCSKKRGISSLVGSLLQACRQLGRSKEKRARSGVEGGGGGRERGILLSSAPLFLSFAFFPLLSISRLSLNIGRMTKIRGIPLLDSVQFRVQYDR